MFDFVSKRVLACALLLSLLVPSAAFASTVPDAEGLQAGGVSTVSLTAMSAGASTASTITTAAATAASTITTAAAQGPTTQLKAAMKMFKVSSKRVIEADSTAIKDSIGIFELLWEAQSKATKASPVIVHVASGTYKYDYGFTIPENVILVAEKKVKFKLGHRVVVAGSLYGGTYQAGGKDRRCIEFENKKFTGKNGVVAYAKVTNAKKEGCYGIVATGSQTKRAQIIGNDVSKSWSGINVFFGANASVIKKNKVHNNQQSGINIVRASAGRIISNTVKNNGGHGISTDIEASTQGPNKCKIKEISKNKITGNGVHGVYLEDRCSVAKMVSNKITGNSRCGLVVATKASAKGLKKNTIKSNGGSSIAKTGPGATVKLLGGNKIG